MSTATAEAEKSNATEYPRVTRTPGVCGGKPCVAGTRVRVQDVYEWHAGGASVDKIIKQFPRLTRADVHAAMAYFWDHEAEVRALMEENRRRLEEAQRAAGPSKLDAYRHLLRESE